MSSHKIDEKNRLLFFIVGRFVYAIMKKDMI